MKHRVSILPLAILLSTGAIFVGTASAQFHEATKDGTKKVNQQLRQPVAPAVRNAPVRRPGDGPIFARGDQNASIYETDYARDPANADKKIGFGQMEDGTAANWGRAIVHSDGSYTTTKQDIEKGADIIGGGSLVIEQLTVSKRGQDLWKRLISLNEVGAPTDVLIYDGRGDLRYRGELVYDANGVFQEEALLSIEGNLLRRTVQPYDQRGQPLPERIFQYDKNLPEGLQIIISEEDGGQAGSTTERIGWLKARQERKDMERQAESRGAESEYGGFGQAGSAQPPEKKGFFKKMFGKDK